MCVAVFFCFFVFCFCRLPLVVFRWWCALCVMVAVLRLLFAVVCQPLSAVCCLQCVVCCVVFDCCVLFGVCSSVDV